MDQPLVSIIVPCYNQAQYLPEALDSVLAQTYDNWECVIVNDGSPDNTEEVAMEYCAKDKRFVYLKQENQGVSSARNNGIKASHGEYILPLDGDDKIAPTYLELVVDHYKKSPETKVVYSNAILFYDDGHEEEWNLPKYEYEALLWSNLFFISSVFRKRDYWECGGFDADIPGLEDWDFWLSFIGKGDVVYKIPETLFFYRNRKCGRNSESNNYDKLRLEYEMIVEKHKELYEPYFKEIMLTKMLLFEKEEELAQIRSSKPFQLGNYIMNLGFLRILRYVRGRW